MEPLNATSLFRPASEELRYLPEGPRALQNYPGGGPLLGWVAIQHGAQAAEGSINILDFRTGANKNIPVPGRPGFFAETTRPGVIVIGLDRALVLFDLATERVDRVLARVTDDERVIINEGLAIDGAVLFGTKDLAFKQPIGAVYRFDVRTGNLTKVLTGQTCSNGKLIWPRGDGFRWFDIDSAPKAMTLYRADRDFERVEKERLVCEPGGLPGFPDGVRDVDGESVLVAFYNPQAEADGVARQIRLADGAVLCEWRIPGSPRVTCPEFLRVDGRVKVIFTTAVEGMPEATRAVAPRAGELFIADVPTGLELPPNPPLLAL